MRSSPGRRFHLIVFDLDGTLIDSRRDIAESANELLAECGVHPLPETQIGRMVGDGAATLIARAFAASGVERPPDALARFVAIYERRLTDSTRPYEGILHVLEVLAGRATLALLTNKPARPTMTILERLALAAFFQPSLVIGGDGPFPRKPDPAGLVDLVRRADVEKEAAVLVGDSMIDCRTARAAATTVCMARYGFGFEDFPADALGTGDLFVDSPEGLLAL
ncbi:MAG TPA: HAD hydrolase-like protein [Vicinamibacterales bacterium]